MASNINLHSFVNGTAASDTFINHAMPSTVDQYLAFARDCVRRAARANRQDRRDALLDSARGWIDAALTEELQVGTGGAIARALSAALLGDPATAEFRYCGAVKLDGREGTRRQGHVDAADREGDGRVAQDYRARSQSPKRVK